MTICEIRSSRTISNNVRCGNTLRRAGLGRRTRQFNPALEIWLCQEDGGNPIETHARAGTPYSFPEKLESGHRCWKHRRLDRRDEDGTFVNTRGAFLQVVTECLAG